MLDPIKVLVVDDSAFYRKVLSTEIQKNPRFKIVGIAADGREAIALVRELKPDVVTLDVEMPVLGGIDALKIIVAESTAAVIMVSAQTNQSAKITLQALELGAFDFISKTTGVGHIQDTLIAAADTAIRARGRQRRRVVSPEPATVPAATAAPRQVRSDIRLIIVGSSTGGPQALVTLLRNLPASLPVPMVIAQHMPPHFTQALATRLNDITPLRVIHARHADRLEPSTIYIAPGGATTRIAKGELSITFNDDSQLYKPSVDVLASSALASYGKHVLGIVLTGMGNDGARELNNLHKAGAYTIAQNQATSVVYGMPKALADLGGANDILPVEEIGQRVAEVLGIRATARAVPLARSQA